MSARDELFQLMLGRTTTKAVERILAAGYRKPRTISTAEELDGLGRDAAVIDANRRVWANDGDSLDQWGCLNHDDYPHSLVWRGSNDIALPATVLYEPTP